MRTTIVIEDTLAERLRGLVSKRGLSSFVNACIREYFERKERKQRQRLLEKAYSRASKNKVFKDFEPVGEENWPEW